MSACRPCLATWPASSDPTQSEPMKITKDTIVTITFRATDAQGKLLEDGKTPRSYLHGGYGNTLPGIEQALEGQAAGFQTSFVGGADPAFSGKATRMWPRLSSCGPAGAAGWLWR